MNSLPSRTATEAVRGFGLALVAVIYAAMLFVFWQVFHPSALARTLGGHLPSAFLGFALLLAPLWLFGFGAAASLRAIVPERAWRTVLAALGCVPYLLFSIPRHEFRWPLALAMAAFPVALTAFLQYPGLEERISWRDGLALLAIAAVLELRLLTPAWPYPGLGSLPKLYLADVTLYAYLVGRGIQGMGYSFVPTRRTLPIALREWVFFAPFGIGLGFALKFITFSPRLPSIWHAGAAVLLTFLLTAVPEELFFRGILQNLLETRLPRTRALLLTSILFGLSHFHKGALVNWRYVLLASIAGVFYGRAWLAERKILTSSITHTAVDVVWGLWFR